MGCKSKDEKEDPLQPPDHIETTPEIESYFQELKYEKEVRECLQVLMSRVMSYLRAKESQVLPASSHIQVMGVPSQQHGQDRLATLMGIEAKEIAKRRERQIKQDKKKREKDQKKKKKNHQDHQDQPIKLGQLAQSKNQDDFSSGSSNMMVKKPAVVFDVDDTILTQWPQACQEFIRQKNHRCPRRSGRLWEFYPKMNPICWLPSVR